MIRKKLHHISNRISLIDTTKQCPIICKNDLPSFWCYERYEWRTYTQYLTVSYRNNDLPCYIEIANYRYRKIKFEKYSTIYRYTGYAMLDNIADPNYSVKRDFKFTNGICIELLKKDLNK